MATEKNTRRYALLLVFEYRKTLAAQDPPTPLPGMEHDLALAFSLCKDRFFIEQGNITIVTDLRERPGVHYPWGHPRLGRAAKPRIVRLPHPDVQRVIQEIAHFVENTVRDDSSRTVEDRVKSCDRWWDIKSSYTEESSHEIFIYISGHGAQIPSPCSEDKIGAMDNALIFTTANGKGRRYLRDDDIFRLLFGKVSVSSSGKITVPVAQRQLKRDITGRAYYSFSDELLQCQVGVEVNDRTRKVNHDDFKLAGLEECNPSPKGQHCLAPDRGLPVTARVLTIIDTCHAATMTDFHYIYDRERKIMLPTRNPPAPLGFPLCVCLSASQDKEETLSTSLGSVFTRHLHNLLLRSPQPLTITQIDRLIYDRLPPLLRRCRPAITSTISDPNCVLPLTNIHSFRAREIYRIKDDKFPT